jgi:laccase
MATFTRAVPWPKIVVREGDRLMVDVHNGIDSNVTFHW